MITSKLKRRIKRELNVEKPTVWVGKEGATSHILNEISRQLEKKKMVKVKMLKTALKDEDAKNVASKVAQQTESILIDVRGHTFILYKNRKKKR
ncbi:MAG: YhbY family RNA-binding protein [Candidatus Bathyarchaeota archaeon]|jgi:RNA-binding protein|nr:YhbY family RNA-binding protein [Candidatus Bathyarchaeota archaeon]MDH5595309.1 YhbY family RNA-binding protein [Candidatus Bathyarchaeota archaeon]